MILAFIGTTELILIAALALLIFGGKKLPELMRGLGKGIKEFKDGMSEVSSIKEGNKDIDNSGTHTEQGIPQNESKSRTVQ